MVQRTFPVASTLSNPADRSDDRPQKDIHAFYSGFIAQANTSLVCQLFVPTMSPVSYHVKTSNSELPSHLAPT